MEMGQLVVSLSSFRHTDEFNGCTGNEERSLKWPVVDQKHFNKQRKGQYFQQ